MAMGGDGPSGPKAEQSVPHLLNVAFSIELRRLHDLRVKAVIRFS